MGDCYEPESATPCGDAGRQRGQTLLGGRIQRGPGLVVAVQRGGNLGYIGLGQHEQLRTPVDGVAQRWALVPIAGDAAAARLAAAPPERSQPAVQQKLLRSSTRHDDSNLYLFLDSDLTTAETKTVEDNGVSRTRHRNRRASRTRHFRRAAPNSVRFSISWQSCCPSPAR